MLLCPAWEELYVPKRYIFVLLGFLGMLCIFVNCVSISVTLVAMVNRTSYESFNISASQMSECPNLHTVGLPSNDGGFKGEKFNWDSQMQGAILGAYFYGYVLMQVPGGVLAEKFGAKWVFGCGVLGCGLISLITPLIASWSVVAFAIIRGLQGMSEGLTNPSITCAISTWSPKYERSRVSTIIFMGAPIGTMLGLSLSGILSSSEYLGGWPSVFYTFGTATCIWFFFWCFAMHESPSHHPSISKAEINIIEANKEEQSKKKSAAVWKNIFKSVPMWALIITHFGSNFGYMIWLLQMPTFLSSVLHFDLQSNGLLSALPFILQATGAFLSSFMADSLRKSNKMSITTIRKIFNSIGTFVPALCLIGVTLSGCQSTLIVALISLSMLINGCVFSGFNVTHVDMYPDLAGTLYAITNAVGNVPGVIGPIIVGIFTSTGATLANWNSVFYLTAAIYVSGGLIFLVFGSAELQSWGPTNKDLQNKDQTIKQAVCVIDIQENQSKL